MLVQAACLWCNLIMFPPLSKLILAVECDSDNLLSSAMLGLFLSGLIFSHGEKHIFPRLITHEAYQAYPQSKECQSTEADLKDG